MMESSGMGRSKNSVYQAAAHLFPPNSPKKRDALKVEEPKQPIGRLDLSLFNQIID